VAISPKLRQNPSDEKDFLLKDDKQVTHLKLTTFFFSRGKSGLDFFQNMV